MVGKKYPDDNSENLSISQMPTTIVVPTVRKKPAPPTLLDECAAVHHTWYSGDPQGSRVLMRKVQDGDEVWGRRGHTESTRVPFDTSQSHEMKKLVEGEFYGLRENGHSEPGIIFQKPMKLPESIDSSDFRPGVQSQLNDRQTLRFFKKQEFDPKTNSTVMSQLITNRFAANDSQSHLPKCPNIITRNISKVKDGVYNQGMKRFASYQIPGSCDDPMLAADGLVSKGAAKKVSKWFQRASAQEQDAFRKLAVAINQRAKRAAQRSTQQRPRAGPSEEEPSGRSHDHWRAEDDISRDRSSEVDITYIPPAPLAPMGHVGTLRVGARAVGEGAFPDGAGADAEQLRPRFRAQFDGTRVHGGQRAEDALGAGALQWVKRELQEHVQARARGLREAWRWMDPGMCGRLDVAALRNLLAELDIPCDAPTARALFDALDVDGDGLLSFEDFCTCLNDTALAERDFFAVSRRPGVMLANEPVIFGPPPQPDGAVPAPWPEHDAVSSEAGPPRLATASGLQFGSAAHPRPATRGPPSAQPGPSNSVVAAGRGTAVLGALRLVESRRALTSNFRAASPKPLRAAAFMPIRYPMRRVPVPDAPPAWHGADVAGEPAAGQRRDVLTLSEGSGRLATSGGLGYKSGPLWAGRSGPGHESLQQARRSATPGPSTERPADIFFMRPRTSMAVHKEAVLLERGSSRTWE